MKNLTGGRQIVNIFCNKVKNVVPTYRIYSFITTYCIFICYTKANCIKTSFFFQLKLHWNIINNLNNFFHFCSCSRDFYSV